jgi:hypothetical protein
MLFIQSDCQLQILHSSLPDQLPFGCLCRWMLPSAVCNAAQGFGLRNSNGRRTCAACPANTVPISCESGLLLRFNASARPGGQWQLRLGKATSCRCGLAMQHTEAV